MTTNNSLDIEAVILAAGKGTRMKSDLPKVLHQLHGTPLLLYVLEAVKKSGIGKATVVVGHEKEKVIETVSEWNAKNPEIRVQFAEQAEQLGTGHALQITEPLLKDKADYLAILLGDVPLIKPETIRSGFETLAKESAEAIVLTTNLTNPTGYGRILRDQNGEITEIKEEKDANAQEKKIAEINTGIFFFETRTFWQFIGKLKSENAQKEYYLTDIVSLYKNNHKKVLAVNSKESVQFQGINSPEDLQQLSQLTELARG